MRCAVYNCRNDSLNNTCRIRFYRFPREKQLLEKWINFCRRDRKFNTQTARICSAHFSLDDFQRNMQFEMGLCVHNGFKLKPGTVPTLATNNYKISEDIRSISEAIPKTEAKPKPVTEPEPVALCRVSVQTCPVSCIAVKASEDDEFIGDAYEPVAFIITKIKEEEKQEAAQVSEAQIREETITEKNAPDDDTFEFVNSINVPSLPGNQQYYDQLKALKEELSQLQHNKIALQETAKQQANKINVLKRRLVKAVYERDNMQEKLLQIFSTEQVNSLKNGTETLAWSEADIEQSSLLYEASSKAYKMLRNKGFPLPDVETLNNWKKLKTNTSSETEICANSAC